MFSVNFEMDISFGPSQKGHCLIVLGVLHVNVIDLKTSTIKISQISDDNNNNLWISCNNNDNKDNDNKDNKTKTTKQKQQNKNNKNNRTTTTTTTTKQKQQKQQKNNKNNKKQTKTKTKTNK